VHVGGVFDCVLQVDVVEVGHVLAHDGLVADHLLLLRLGHDAHLQQDLRLEGRVDVQALEVREGVLEELGHTLVDPTLRDVVDDVQRFVERQRVVVDIGDDFERVRLHG